MRLLWAIPLLRGATLLSDDRHNLYAPDVAFVSKARMPDSIPQTFAGFMPDLAVEIASPSNTVAKLHSKALIYLRNGTHLVWILYPVRESAEVCRLDDEANLKAESFGIDVPLSGEDVLPGFELDLRRLFKR
ncbi:MAG: Uma2 family endonuclease [Chloroflexi bacterium]|nr:Uma2 family endonuclease [Chloroflexota bacterium]